VHANATPRHPAGRGEWVGLAVLALPCLLYAMDLTVLNLAVPHLSAELQPSSTQLLWIVDVYGFLVAGFLVTMGTLGDRIGRRRLLLAGAAAFGAASVLAALSTSAGMLIAARALLGVAGATVAPSTLSLIRNMFADPRQRTLAISVWITSFSVGGAIGPLAGGMLLEWFWWGSVFLLAVPVMALLLVLGPILLPEYRDPRAGRLDLVSAGMSLAAVLAVVYGLKQLAQDGAGWPPALWIVAGLAVGVAFVRRQQTLAEPLLDLRLFRVPAFSAALTTNVLSFFVGFGTLLFVAQYLQLVLGLSPLAAGLWMLPASAGFVVGSMLTPLLGRRVRPGLVMAGGLALAAVGFGLLTRLGSDHAAGLAVLVAGSVIFSLALAPVDTLAADLAVGAAPPERAGAVSALSETSAELGGALGIAVLGSIATVVYRGQLGDAVPAGIAPQAAAAARDTLGGALGGGKKTPPPPHPPPLPPPPPPPPPPTPPPPPPPAQLHFARPS
jgi:MFS transporter, DHA2 family, multidrug resistance protein